MKAHTTARSTILVKVEARVGTLAETVAIDLEGWGQNRDHPSDYRFIQSDQHNTKRTYPERRKGT